VCITADDNLEYGICCGRERGRRSDFPVMTADWDGKIGGLFVRLPWRAIQMRDKFYVAFANDTDLPIGMHRDGSNG